MVWFLCALLLLRDRLTVDGNGHGLGEDIAIGALEGWDLAQAVQLLVVVANALGWLGVDQLDVEVVGLRDGEESGGARVALSRNTHVSLIHDCMCGRSCCHLARGLFMPFVAVRRGTKQAAVEESGGKVLTA